MKTTARKCKGYSIATGDLYIEKADNTIVLCTKVMEEGDFLGVIIHHEEFGFAGSLKRWDIADFDRFEGTIELTQ